MLMQMTNATLLNPTPIYPKHLLLRKDIPVIILHHHPSRRTDIRPTVIIAATATGGHATITETIAIGITCTAIVVVALTVNYASTGGSNNSTASINTTVPALANVTGIANSTVPNHTHSVDAIVPIHAYISSHTHSSGRNDGSPCRRVCRYDASIYAFPGHWQTFCTRPRFANIIRGSGRVTLSTSPNDSIKNAGVGKLGIIRLQSAIKLFVFSINHKFVKFVIHDEFRFRFFGSLHGLRTRMVGVGARMKRSARLGISFARGQVGENA